MKRALASVNSPKEFGIVVDTREQTPWEFAPDVPVTRATLTAGDYAPQGSETRCAIERKTLGDFVACVTWQRERFVRELEKLRSYDFACIIVEAAVADVFAHRYESKAHPNSVIGSALAFAVDYRTAVYWAGERRHAADMAYRLLKRWWATHTAESAEKVAA
jgi:DNA excision repair protein ERCC-4